jgi:hypothetical protein
VFLEVDPIEPDMFLIPGPTGPTGPSGGGASSIISTTVTVPAGTISYVAVVTNVSILVTSKIMITLGSYVDTDVNDPDLDQIEFHVETISAGNFQLELSARSGTIGGPFKFNYLVG